MLTDPRVHRQFTEAECWLLAWELHTRTGLPLWACSPPGVDLRLYWVHVALQAGETTFLDINGLQSLRSISATWGRLPWCPLPVEVTASWETYFHFMTLMPEPEDGSASYYWWQEDSVEAGPVADALLARYLS